MAGFFFGTAATACARRSVNGRNPARTIPSRPETGRSSGQNSIRQVLDALVPVVGWRHQSQRRAVLDRQGAPVERVGEQDIAAQKVLERQCRAISILTAQHDEGRRAMRTGSRGDEQSEYIGEPHATLAQRATRPRRHAVEIGRQRDTRQSVEFVLDRDRLLGFAGDLEGDPARITRKAPGKLAHSKAREPIDRILSGRQRHGRPGYKVQVWNETDARPVSITGAPRDCPKRARISARRAEPRVRQLRYGSVRRR
jgi:hypothetical protein